MSLRQKLGCAIRLRGHEPKHLLIDGWVVSTCERCGAVSELPVSAYSVQALVGGDPGMGMPGAWIGFADGIGSGDSGYGDSGCGDSGCGDSGCGDSGCGDGGGSC
jgi:hypothetical protein